MLLRCVLLLACLGLPLRAADLVGTPPQRQANELGQVLILMYHGIGRPEGEWQRTPGAFAADLDALYTRGYRPIALRDYVRGHIETKAGLSPVVLTFDDGRRNNLDLVDGPRGQVASPDSAVGILQAFAAAHPDFPLEATFYLSGARPFGDSNSAQTKVRYLLEAGLDIGNHTDAHANLATARYASASAIQATIGNQAARLADLAGPGYEVDTYALCHGARPKDHRLWPLLVAGQHRGRPYRHVAVLNVGGPPAPSPFATTFDPASLPRVRGSDHPTAPRGLYYWLERFDKDPASRFVSDGDPHVVTAPRAQADQLSIERVGERRVVWE